MWEFKIQLHSVQEVQAFVALATEQPFPIRVGNEYHEVSAQSFMEIFCLDLTKPQTVKLDCSEAAFHAFREAVARFAVN